MKDLTKADIEYIKGEKRIGYVFSFIVLFAGCLFDLPYYLIYGIDYIFLIINPVNEVYKYILDSYKIC